MPLIEIIHRIIYRSKVELAGGGKHLPPHTSIARWRKEGGQVRLHEKHILSRFHLWLIALGIQLSFGCLRAPEDQAITERSHQIWDHQVLEGSPFETIEQLLSHSMKVSPALPSRSNPLYWPIHKHTPLDDLIIRNMKPI